MRTTLSLAALVLLALPAALHAADASPGRRPNILWITAEDICPNLGCYGDPDAVTPNLDSFASQGVRFVNCFSVHPCCSPSRSALATGVYPTRLGTFQHRGKMWVNAELVKCFPSWLRSAGYYTFNGSRGGSAKLDYNFEPQDKPWDKIGSRQGQAQSQVQSQPVRGGTRSRSRQAARAALSPRHAGGARDLGRVSRSDHADGRAVRGITADAR
ncbi:MAG: sulfatase-like hydrolase/transferase [Pirellulaceae bacterium]|nr:sulfatase-like hydrolase/transferase [Pirellulaceae bacterium]